jgi:hypothetical protein
MEPEVLLLSSQVPDTTSHLHTISIQATPSHPACLKYRYKATLSLYLAN